MKGVDEQLKLQRRFVTARSNGLKHIVPNGKFPNIVKEKIMEKFPNQMKT